MIALIFQTIGAFVAACWLLLIVAVLVALAHDLWTAPTTPLADEAEAWLVQQ